MRHPFWNLRLKVAVPKAQEPRLLVSGFWAYISPNSNKIALSRQAANAKIHEIPKGETMNIFDRAKDIIMNPRQTWESIKTETIDIKSFFINYAAPLALIPTICGFIGISLVGIRFPAGHIARAPFFQALLGGVLGYLVNLVALYAGAWAVKFIAPFFNAKSDLNSAVKVVVYSMTPAWLVGIFSLVPGLSILSILALYAIYLLYLGLEIILETPIERVIWFTLSVLLAGVMISFVTSIIMINIVYGPMYMRMMAL
jgi:hypothetical protein